MNCPNCGLQIQDNLKYCPNCGTPIAPSSAEPQPEPTPVTITEPEPTPSTQSSAEQPIQESQPNSMEKTLAIEAYLSLLVLAPLFGAKNSAFVKFHVNQGIILCALSLVFSALISFNSIIMGVANHIAVYIILGLFTAVFGLATCGVIALAVIGILNVLKGRMKPLPVIGKFKIIK